MRVLIDGDGCPVVAIAAQVCQMKQVPCLLLCDTAHEMRRGDVQVLTLTRERTAWTTRWPTGYAPGTS